MRSQRRHSYGAFLFAAVVTPLQCGNGSARNESASAAKECFVVGYQRRVRELRGCENGAIAETEFGASPKRGGESAQLGVEWDHGKCLKKACNLIMFCGRQPWQSKHLDLGDHGNKKPRALLAPHMHLSSDPVVPIEVGDDDITVERVHYRPHVRRVRR